MMHGGRTLLAGIGGVGIGSEEAEEVVLLELRGVDVVDVVLGGVGNDIGVAGQSGKGSELCGAVEERHL